MIVEETMDDEEYVENCGNLCPFCQGDDEGIISTDMPNVDSGVIWQSIKCLDCNEEWIDTYVLTGFILPHC